MDVRVLRYFLAVAELGNLSRAARQVRISQPALSRQMQRLEQELGRPLLIRRGHGVTLTDAGHRLSERAQVILRQIQKAVEEVRDGGKEPSGTLTLAVPPAAGTVLVPALARRLSERFPHITLRIAAGYSSYISDWLVRGLVDLACLHDPLPQRSFEIIPLLKEEVFVVGRRELLETFDGPIGAADLVRLPLVLPSRPNASRRLLDGWAALRGLSLDVRLEVDDTSIIRALIKNGAGVSLLSRGSFQSELLHGELLARPLRPRTHWPLALVVPMSEPRSALAELAAGEIRALVQALLASGAWPGGSVSASEKRHDTHSDATTDNRSQRSAEPANRRRSHAGLRDG
jgi:LysR family transcriptional regulator, nitrogen assimilation regulatory protein